MSIRFLTSITAVVYASASVFVAASGQAPQDKVPTRQQAELFNTKIRPVLFDTCGECHLDDEEGGLRIDSREALLKGGENGPAIVPGEPENSLLIHAILRDGSGPRMPKDRPKLSVDTIAAFEQWIRDGAPWPPDKLEGSARQIAQGKSQNWKYER